MLAYKLSHALASDVKTIDKRQSSETRLRNIGYRMHALPIRTGCNLRSTTSHLRQLTLPLSTALETMYARLLSGQEL